MSCDYLIINKLEVCSLSILPPKNLHLKFSKTKKYNFQLFSRFPESSAAFPQLRVNRRTKVLGRLLCLPIIHRTCIHIGIHSDQVIDEADIEQIIGRNTWQETAAWQETAVVS